MIRCNVVSCVVLCVTRCTKIVSIKLLFRDDGPKLGGWVGGPSINNLARTIMNSKMGQIHGAG